MLGRTAAGNSRSRAGSRATTQHEAAKNLGRRDADPAVGSGIDGAVKPPEEAPPVSG
jgi:hypothetical protein